ncbi:MAG: hypothetical protein U0667_13060 [Chloroflexota bacterium]
MRRVILAVVAAALLAGWPGTSLAQEVTFPSEVAGLPVMGVAEAEALLRSGTVDGQAVAVAGYFDAFLGSCPAPLGPVGPLEDWCRFVAFTDMRADAQLCRPTGDGSVCSSPSGTYVAPFVMGETSGDPRSWLSGGWASEPAALVLIGHVGDPRQWQCPTDTQAECAGAFVVDRVAWAEGASVPPTAPETGDGRTGAAIAPRMTLDQVATVIGLDDERLLTGAPFRAADIATVDPRWNLVGDEVTWLVRSLDDPVGSDAAAPRPETAWLVDDATGSVIDSHPLRLDPTYQPARLWQTVTVHGASCCASDVLAYARVAADDGTVVFEGMLPGGESGGEHATTYGGGYGSWPLILPAGRYSVSTWLARSDAGIMGTPRRSCSTPVSLGPLDDVTLAADFPRGKACVFQPMASPVASSDHGM